MPDKSTIIRVRREWAQGKAPSTLDGNFVREEMDHIRQGLHGARSTKQAIAIGLSKARRAGVKLPAPAKGKASASTRRKAEQDLKAGARSKRSTPSRKRSKATVRALKREGRSAASKSALSRQGRAAAKDRTRAQRSASARKAARTRAENR